MRKGVVAADVAPADVVIEIAPEGGAAPAADVVVVREKEDDDALPHQATELDDGSVDLALRYPVTLRWRSPGSSDVREEVFERLTMRRLTGADMKAIAAAGKGGTIVAVARSCGMAPGRFNAMFDLMDGADTAAAFQVVAYFLGNGRPSGG